MENTVFQRLLKDSLNGSLSIDYKINIDGSFVKGTVTLKHKDTEIVSVSDAIHKSLGAGELREVLAKKAISKLLSHVEVAIETLETILGDEETDEDYE